MQEREDFLDKLRVAATCAVVLLHTITGVMDITDMSPFPLENKVFLAALDLICWCVPVFVVISGYLFLNPARKVSMRDMLTKYCRRILLALFLFGVPYACLEQIALEHTFKIGMLGKSFLMVLRGESWSHMWYLYLILILYLITPALKWLLERIPDLVVWVLLGELAAVSSILPCLAGFLGWEYPTALLGQLVYLFYYMCGYLFAVRRSMGGGQGRTARRQEKFPREKKAAGTWKFGRGLSVRILTGTAAVIALGAVICRLSGIFTARTTYNAPLAVVLALLLFSTGLVWSRSAYLGIKNTGFWKQKPKQVAALTFAVYLVHPVFLNFSYKFLHITPLSFNIWISLPLFFLGTLFFSTAAAWGLRRIPVLRRYVL